MKQCSVSVRGTVLAPLTVGLIGTPRMLSSFWSDARIGGRMLARRPGYTLVALATLTLGIATTTTIFSFVDAVLLKPLPYANADRIVRVLETRPSGVTSWVSTPDYLDWKAENSVFEYLAARQQGLATITGREMPLPVTVGRVSANFFDVFGVEAYVGRLFIEGEDLPGSEHVVVLSHSLWQREYGSDLDLVGESLLLDGEPYTVVGILAAGSAFDRTGVDIWHPLALPPVGASRSYRWLNSTVGLLRSGISLDQARAQMRAISARIATEYPDTNRDWGVSVDSYADTIVGAPLRTSMLVLTSAVAGLLLICCANLASLVLARTVSRSTEVSLRISLGATPARIAGHFLVENLLLAIGGSILGIGLAVAGVAWIKSAIPAGVIPSEANVALDLRASAFAVTVSIASSVVFALAPLAGARRLNGSTSIEKGVRGATISRRALRFLDALVVVEVALSVVLALCATLLTRSFVELMNVDTGADVTDALTMRLPVPGFPPGSVYSEPAEFQAYVRDVLAEVEAVPGVSGAAITSALPLTDCCLYLLTVRIEGKPQPDRAEQGGGFFKIVTPSYLDVLGLRLLSGRFLSNDDIAGGRPVIVINKRLADRFFIGEDPIGQRILNPEILPGRTERGDLVAWEIVGVVDDETATSLDDDASAVAYASYEQSPAYFANLIVSSAADDAASLEPSIRNAVQRIAPSQSILDVRTLDQLRSASAGSSRFRAVLLNSFSVVAVLLASVGLFGVLAYSVAQRGREIGVRSALGATRTRLLLMVLGRGLVVAATGIGIGLVIAYTVLPLINGILYGVEPHDPLVIAAVSGAFLAVATLAGLAPALRAARVDPNAMLRGE
jgi:putative ABC transport system permease protein